MRVSLFFEYLEVCVGIGDEVAHLIELFILLAAHLALCFVSAQTLLFDIQPALFNFRSDCLAFRLLFQHRSLGADRRGLLLMLGDLLVALSDPSQMAHRVVETIVLIERVLKIAHFNGIAAHPNDNLQIVR